jgi:hypothetical protein
MTTSSGSTVSDRNEIVIEVNWLSARLARPGSFALARRLGSGSCG